MSPRAVEVLPSYPSRPMLRGREEEEEEDREEEGEEEEEEEEGVLSLLLIWLWSLLPWSQPVNPKT